MQAGANKGWSVPIDELVPMYWQGMGWDAANGSVVLEDIALKGLA